MRVATGLVLVLLVVGASACGGDGGGDATDDGDNSAVRFQGEQRDAAQAVENFATAIRNRNWKRICNELFTANERDLQKGLIADSCEGEVDRYGKVKGVSLTVTRVDVERSADVTADTAAGAEAGFDLKKENGRWLIDGTFGDFTASGSPSGGPPTATGDRAAAEQVVLDFDQALADRDWAAVCDLYTEDRREQAFDSCESDARESYGNGALGLTVSDVKLKTEARVSARSGASHGASFTLVPEGGRWRIEGYGGTFGPG